MDDPLSPIPSSSQPTHAGNDSSFVFLKLGGSLITVKDKVHTPRLVVLDRLAQEIAAARKEQPGFKLLLGHGSGSFGHIPAKKYGTRHGVSTPDQWQGFVEVWREATALDQIVIDAFTRAGLPAIALQPSAAVMARAGQVDAWDLSPLLAALEADLLPVVYGDVIFDRVRGGTILSTEDLFGYLARKLRPRRLLLAGIEPGVWADFPACTRIMEVITPESLFADPGSIQGSLAPDVTGGMASKVAGMLSLAQVAPEMDIRIFSGEEPGMVTQAILGRPVGTRVSAAIN